MRDTSGFRADGRVNETIRRLARERGFIVRDTEAALVARGAGVAPGWETFRDNCHLAVRAVSEEATAVLALARAAVGLPSVEAACRRRDRLARARLHLRHGEVSEARVVLDQAPLDAASQAEAAALRSVLAAPAPTADAARP